MNEISTGVLRDIVKDRERMGESTISVEELLSRLQLTAIVDPDELGRLRAIETLARKMMATPRWELRGNESADAEQLRRLVHADTD